MFSALEMLLAEPRLTGAVIAGLVATGIAVGHAARRASARRAACAELLRLAKMGQADEARIQARKAAGQLQAMLDALNGRLRPKASVPAAAIVSATAVFVWPSLAVFAAWQAAFRSDPDERVIGIAAALTALAILLPAALIAAALIMSLYQRGARAVRGVAVQALLEANAPREPRGRA